jgi:hypothetical protein
MAWLGAGFTALRPFLDMEVLKHAFLEPFEIAGAFAAILEHSRPFERDQAAFHHFVKHGQEGVDLLLGVANLDHDRTLIGGNVMRFMKPAGVSEAEGALYCLSGR